MSLPTHAIFYKGEKAVGAGFCNPGWTLNPESLMPCIKQSMDDAWDRYRPESERLQESEDFSRNEKYFTNADDLKNFEYMEVFEIKIPRHIALHVYFGQMTLDQWKGFLIVEKHMKYSEPDVGTYTDAYAEYILSNMAKQKQKEGP